MADRLVNWTSLDLTIDGTKLEKIVARQLRSSGAPIEDLAISFEDSRMRVEGYYRKIIPIPFRVEIERFEIRGDRIEVPLASVSAAGLPVPKLLTSLFEATAAGGAVRFNGDDGPRLIVRLDRFLPDFVDVEIAEMRIIQGGLFVRMSSGGADPPDIGGSNGRRI